MCGIAGYSGTFDVARLELANARQAHRGPDDSGIFVDDEAKVGLGHVRLSILDVSTNGHQPMSRDNGSVILIFNGEIYNFRELRQELEGKGRRFTSKSDTEVLLQLYIEEGEAMLRRLNGIFAIAIWDRRTQILLVARDALGVKPLYYTENSAGIAFASEVKALLCLAPETRALDVVAIHRYLSFLWCPGNGTPFRDVKKLGPGEAFLVKNGKIQRHWTWYQLPVFRGVVGDLTREDAIRKTEDLLRQAVHRQMVADVPVGAFLSGGLDSSAVVAFAREVAPDIRCFTIANEGGQEAGMADDLPYAQKVARYLNVPLEIVSIDSRQMADDIGSMVAQLDEPLADPAALNVLYISRRAREQGIKVLLSGAAGDDLFSGYRRHIALSYERYWKWLPSSLRSQLAGWTGEIDQRRPFFRRISKLFSGAALDCDQGIANYFIWAKESTLFNLYSDDFRAQLGHEAANTPMLDFLRPLPASTPDLARMLALEQRFFLVDHNLNYTDKMSMAAGVEVRVPFLDLDLVEHAAHIPVQYKQEGRVSKAVLKSAMLHHLPREVIYRPKSGFGAPLRRWLRHELKPLLNDVLSVESLQRRGLFNPKTVHRLIDQNERGQVDAAYTLLSLVCIELWCRTNLDGKVSYSLAGRTQ